MTQEPIRDPLEKTMVIFGCDPEFFFEKKGKIIGSEKIINIEKGLKVVGGAAGKTGPSKFIVDGVQAELNPVPNTCRQSLAMEISRSFNQLYTELKKDKDLSINFAPTIKITKEELISLDERSRRFGCSPSKNTDTKHQNAATLRDPAVYRYRSAGGHIHLGYYGDDNNSSSSQSKIIMREPARLVQILDIIVGNTCVLIDRDKGNIERRKVYGRAGEYRTPAHGVEYRTLSNFWLRSYPLMSFVFNLSRLAVSIMANSMPGRDYEKELLSLINIKDIQRAINSNNFLLAWNNFQKIKPFIARVCTESGGFPLTANTLPTFEFFVSKGIDYWFKENPLEHWLKVPSGGSAYYGWEAYLSKVVTPEMMKQNPTPAPTMPITLTTTTW